MRVKKTFGSLSLFAVGLLACSPMTVFATSDTGSAVRDILMDDRFSGAMSQIEWLTKMVDNWFIQIITVTAFFIISMALLKNAMAAAYCAFPVFFDRVHAAHEQMKWSEQSLGGLKDLGSKLRDGKISDVILSLIPDFKALTDFVEQDMSPKQYFMKAIPQMCIMVVIGIFIYNGYYRDVSATVGEAGATMIENLLGSVSPEKAVNDIFNLKKDPVNTYKKDKTIEGKFIYELSQSIYKEVKNNSTVYKETAENKEQLMRCCEKVAYDMVKGTHNGYLTGYSGDSPFKGTDQYDLKLSNVQAKLATTGTGGYCNTDTTDGSRAFRYEFKLSDILNTSVADSEENLKGKMLVVTGNLSPVAKSNETFETAIEAVQGDMTAVGLGFSSVTITMPGTGNGVAQFTLEQLKAAAEPEIERKITADGKYTFQSVKAWNGVNAGKDQAGFQVARGAEKAVCSVVVSYVELGTNANGEATQGVTKTAEITIIVRAE